MSKKSKQLSKNIQQLRDIALTITKDRKISVVYNSEAPTACINLKTLRIQLSPNIIPKAIHNYPRMFQRCLDAEVSHESGHYSITRPMESRYERFNNSKKFKGLARLVTNIVEDKRVNYFIEKRYRFDLGKRLAWFNGIMCKAGKSTIESMIQKNFDGIKNAIKPAIMVNLLIHVGLYNGEINSVLWKQLNQAQQKDTQRALKLLEKAKFTWIKHDLLKINEEIYQLIEKHIDIHEIKKLMKLCHASIEGGELGLDLSEDDESDVAEEEEAESEAEKDREDLSRGGGAGVSTGEHIPAPEANFKKYFEYCDRNQPEIDKLLNKLKQFVKPITKRTIFRKHGRIMAPLLSRACTNSYRKGRTVTRIYQKFETYFEKQKIALGFLIDFSGSMSYEVACNTVTIMNEVFGNWLDDESYSILVFGADYQKIKTFFESFANTRARIGGISVNSGGTMVANPLEDMRKMFHMITKEKQKILVLCTDFWFGDESETEEIIKRMIQEGIIVLFIGLCSGDEKIHNICPNDRNIYRAFCEKIEDLPDFFIEIYMKSIGNLRK